MQEKIKISVVSYLNSKPFIAGLTSSEFIRNNSILQLDIPSICADNLLSGKSDLGLVPVASIPLLKESHIYSEFCIGARGKVRSVILLSDTPVEQLEKIYLDLHSRTSNALTRILCKHFWNIKPEFISPSENFERKLLPGEGKVIIGDRAFSEENNFRYCYDLSFEWTQFTGLPFVFACWTANKILPEEFTTQFNLALSNGINSLDRVVADHLNNHKLTDHKQIKDYLVKNISFVLTPAKRQGMELFLKLLARENG